MALLGGLRRTLGVIVPLSILAGVGWAGSTLIGHKAPHASHSKTSDRPPVVVTTTQATARALDRSIHVVGNLAGWEEIEISPKVEGPVVRVHHEVGDVVKPGDILAEIDPTDFQLAVTEMQRGLELELSKVGLTELPTGDVDVSQLPTVVRAAARERNASLRLERMKRLGGSAASAEDRDQIESDYLVARADSRQAVLDARTAIASARARYASLQTTVQRMRDTRVIVPTLHSLTDAVEFVICERKVTEGEIVRVMTPEPPLLFRLAITRHLKLKAHVPERHLGNIQAGQKVDLRVEAYPRETFQGKVERVYPSVDPASRTFLIEVQIDNADGRLRPGSFARATIHTHTDASALTVPEEAIVRYAGVTKVFTFSDGIAQSVEVRAGATMEVVEDGQAHVWVEVEGSLTPGTSIITSGLTQLADNTPVSLRGLTDEK